MDTARIIPTYLLWHYTKALKDSFGVWLNFVWFVGHFFSIGTLLLSLFSPWKRMTEERSQSFNLEDFAGVLLINIMSRVIGALVRICIIVLGLVSFLASLVCIVTFYLVWIGAPVIISGVMLYGIVALF